MTESKLNEIFKAVGEEMLAENIGAKITENAIKAMNTENSISAVVSATISASNQYTQELLFRVLGRIFKNAD